MELWDLHHIRRLDDIGFIDALYGERRAEPKQNDPEFKQQQEERKAEAVAAVKACGHLEGVDCGCH